MIELIISSCIITAGIVLAAQLLRPRHNPARELKRGTHYVTLDGRNVLITNVTPQYVAGHIISAGFTAPLRTPCQWDKTGRALANSRNYDLREDV